MIIELEKYKKQNGIECITKDNCEKKTKAKIIPFDNRRKLNHGFMNFLLKLMPPVLSDPYDEEE